MSAVSWLILGSVLVQLTAAVAALTLIRTTRRRAAWLLFTGALVLMTLRRGISLVGGLGGQPVADFAVGAEVVALLISLLLLLAVLDIRRILDTMRHEEKVREEALRREADVERRYRLVVDHMPEGFVLAGSGGITFANPAFGRIFGIRPREARGRSLSEFLPADVIDLDGSVGAHSDLDSWDVLASDVRIGGDGSEPRLLNVRIKRVAWENEPGLLCVLTDVTDRRRAEAAEQREARLFAHGPVVVMRWRGDRRVEFVSENVRQWGFDPDRLRGESTLYELVHPADAGRVKAEAQEAFAAGRESWSQEYRLRCPDGHEREVFDVTVAARDESGRLVHTDGYLLDVTEHRRAEASLARSDAVLRAVSFAAERFLQLSDWRSGIEAALARLGEAAEVSRAYVFENRSEGRAAGTGGRRWEWVAPGVEKQIEGPALQDADWVRSGFGGWLSRMRAGETVVATPEDAATPGRELLAEQGILALVVAPVIVGDELWGFMGFDQCDRQRRWSSSELEALRVAAQTLGAAILRQRVEEQLRQAHKIEAVGQLAGGIAHDFNNLLTALMGSAELLRRRLPREGESSEHLEAIQRTAERAAELTRRLLAFSRRQRTEPHDLDLNQLVADFLPTVRRVIPENIVLDFVPGHGLGVVRADRGQLEQVLMNLCVNARDAMPEGGALTLETENVFINGTYIASHPWARAGRYVLLSVSDTGEGMGQEVLDRVFEPFFTTKDPGKGTGLGLASVYGIVKQADGMVNGYSELGKGSTFKVYLPLVERPAGEVGAKIDGPVRGGSETILVVEDEPEVRRVVAEFLAGLGYRVTDAADGREALEVLRREAVDLVITDMVMPHMGGLELFRAASEVVQSTAFLFSSGYSEAALGPAGVQEGMHFIAKPYGLDQLARTVRAILESSGGRAPT